MPYDSIAARTGVSKGSVVTIVEQLKAGKIPGFKDLGEIAEELRELSVKLKKQGLSASEAALGFTFFQQLAELGIEPELLRQWVKLCREIVPEESTRRSLLHAAARLVKVEEDTGVTYDELTARCEAKAAEAKQLEARITALKTDEEKAQAAVREAAQALAKKCRFVDAEKRRLDGELKR